MIEKTVVVFLNNLALEDAKKVMKQNPYFNRSHDQKDINIKL